MTTPPFAAMTSSIALPAGTRLGEFEITGVIGEGGFGIVYSAHDSSLDRVVAVKEYLPSAFSQRTGNGVVQVKSVDHSGTFAAGLSSFINEAKMLAKFSHPGLVEVFRFWEANGTAYMAMRYYRGQTLRELLRTTPQIVTEQWLCETLDPLLLALKVLHLEKCYHRDIAPDNILVLPNGHSVLMDFGATRRIIGGMTQALTTILKPGFAPIEQYSEDGSMEQGAWTDIYAFGGLLYNAMTGKIPVQAISRLMSDPLKPVATLARASFSPQLCAVVMKCLAVMPANRYQSVDELRDALGWVTTQGISTVVHRPPAVVPSVDDDPTTVVIKLAAKAAVAVVPEAPIPSDPLDALTRSVTSGPSIALKEPVVPTTGFPAQVPAQVPTQVPIEVPVQVPAAVTDELPDEVLNEGQPEAVTAPGSSRKSRIAMMGLALAAVVAVGAVVIVYSNSRQSGETASTATAPAKVPAAAVPAAAQAPTDLPSASAAGNRPVSPAPLAAAVTELAQPPVPSTGFVRFELKDGWGTVFVDGEQKGVAPPVLVVKLSPGSHVIEIRNPALPTYRRNVEVIAGTTVPVRYKFGK
jgi:non-specific serine/threonine protein kinase